MVDKSLFYGIIIIEKGKEINKMVINNKVSEIRNLWREKISGDTYPMPLEWTPDPNSIIKYEFVKTIITKIW